MSDQERPGERIVTPEQLRDGYTRVLRMGTMTPDVRQVPYSVIRRLDDGNYLVREPEALTDE